MSGITKCFHGQREHYLRWRVPLKYQTSKSPKRANHLSSDFFLSSVQTVSQASTMTAEVITMIQTQKNQHKSLSIALTTYRDLSTRTILQWFSSTPMLILSAIRHFVRTTLFIACTPPAESSTEHVFAYSFNTVKDEDGNCQGRWYNAKHRSGICMLPGEVL